MKSVRLGALRYTRQSPDYSVVNFSQAIIQSHEAIFPGGVVTRGVPCDSTVVVDPSRAHEPAHVASIEKPAYNSPFPETTPDRLYGFDKDDDPWV